MRHSVKSELLQQLMSYLSTRPFNEVHKLISELASDAKPIEEPKTQNSE
jgi:hypothetical protein